MSRIRQIGEDSCNSIKNNFSRCSSETERDVNGWRNFWKAHELAMRGAELGHPTCRWLAAAAYDRWLMNQGKPQKYGTQYVTREGRWVLYEVDPTTTDAERGDWNVPPLAESLQRAEEMNQTMPPGEI